MYFIYLLSFVILKVFCILKCLEKLFNLIATASFRQRAIHRDEAIHSKTEQTYCPCTVKFCNLYLCRAFKIIIVCYSLWKGDLSTEWDSQNTHILVDIDSFLNRTRHQNEILRDNFPLAMTGIAHPAFISAGGATCTRRDANVARPRPDNAER